MKVKFSYLEIDEFRRNYIFIFNENPRMFCLPNIVLYYVAGQEYKLEKDIPVEIYGYRKDDYGFPEILVNIGGFDKWCKLKSGILYAEIENKDRM